MQGLWLGIICALIVQATSLGIITARTNWEKEVSHSFYLFTFFFLLVILCLTCVFNLFIFSYLISRPGKESNG